MHRKKNKRNNQRMADISNQLCIIASNFAIVLFCFWTSTAFWNNAKLEIQKGKIDFSRGETFVASIVIKKCEATAIGGNSS